MTNSQASEITFPVVGIFGVGRLATILKGLADSGEIGPWRVGQWTDFRHTAIRIQFDTGADGELAEGFVRRSRLPQLTPEGHETTIRGRITYRGHVLRVQTEGLKYAVHIRPNESPFALDDPMPYDLDRTTAMTKAKRLVDSTIVKSAARPRNVNRS